MTRSRSSNYAIMAGAAMAMSMGLAPVPTRNLHTSTRQRGEEPPDEPMDSRQRKRWLRRQARKIERRNRK